MTKTVMAKLAEMSSMKIDKPRLIEKTFRTTSYIEFVELTPLWDPWRFQVNTYLYDGGVYGRHGQTTRIAMSNFLEESDARALYEKMKERDSGLL